MRVSGADENDNGSVHDLTRRDIARAGAEAFEQFKAELAKTFAAPDDEYAALDAETVLARNRPRAPA